MWKSKIDQLEPWLGTLKAVRDKYLLQPEDDFRAQDVLHKIENGWQRGEVVAPELVGAPTQHGLPAVEQEIVQLKHKRRLLEAKLPSEEEVASAQRQAIGLARQATERSEDFEQSWSAFMAALAEAEASARAVVEARAKAQETLHELSELRAQNALDIDVPQEPRPSPSEEKLAGLLGLLLRDVGHSQIIDRGLGAEMASAQQQVERKAA